MEGLIIGGAYLRREICWANLIFWRKLPFLLCLTLYLRAISKFWRGFFSEFYGIKKKTKMKEKKNKNDKDKAYKEKEKREGIEGKEQVQ